MKLYVKPPVVVGNFRVIFKLKALHKILKTKFIGIFLESN